MITSSEFGSKLITLWRIAFKCVATYLCISFFPSLHTTNWAQGSVRSSLMLKSIWFWLKSSIILNTTCFLLIWSIVSLCFRIKISMKIAIDFLIETKLNTKVHYIWCNDMNSTSMSKYYGELYSFRSCFYADLRVEEELVLEMERMLSRTFVRYVLYS